MQAKVSKLCCFILKYEQSKLVDIHTGNYIYAITGTFVVQTAVANRGTHLVTSTNAYNCSYPHLT